MTVPPDHRPHHHSSFGPQVGGSGWTGDEGRIARSIRLVGQSWQFLRERPRLLVLPTLAAIAVAVTSVGVLIPALHVFGGLPHKLAFALALGVWSLPCTLVTVACNVGFLEMARAHIEGREPTIRVGLRAIRERRRAILIWSLLSAVVGSIFGALQELPGGDWLGRLVGWLGGLAWGLATFFVVPVLVVEDIGPVDAIRRSARVFRARWGESVAGELGIGVVFGLAMVPGGACVGVAFATYGDDMTAAALLLTIGLVWMAPLLVWSAALADLFRYVLYREATAGLIEGPWSAADVRTALRPRKAPWWRRRSD